MARHETSERPGAERLAALRLPMRATGWVPEGAAPAADPLEAPATEPSPEPAVVGPAVVGPAELARGWTKDRTPPWLHGAVDRATVGSVITAFAAVAAVVIALVMVVHRHSSPGYATSYPSSSTATGGSSTGTGGYAASSPDPATIDSASIVVDVGGRVRHPGLVTLPTGARVADAIAAAGGPLRHRELAATNLAARVTDGQLLVIGGTASSPPPAADPSASSPTAAAPVDLNAATLEELETLPGVGPVTGQKIIDWRTAHSGFTSVEQLQQVSGIGPATYAELSPLVTP
jgi:competence protein ComEA